MRNLMLALGAGLLGTLLAMGGCTPTGSGCKMGDSCSKSCPEGESGLCVARDICECVPGNHNTDGGVNDADVAIVDDCRAAGAGDLVLTEIMVDGEGVDDDTEFVEILNVANEPVSVRGLQLNQVSGSDSVLEMTLEAGCIPALGAVAFFHNIELSKSYPSTGIAFTVVGGNFAFPNSKSVDYTLTDVHGGLMSQLEVAESQIVSGVSVGRPEPDSEDFDLHTIFSDLPSSPGLCPNGGAYYLGCEAPPEDDAGTGGTGGQPICDPPVAGDLVLNEVLVDGEADRDGNEFVELVNTANRPVSLVGISVGKSDANPMVVFDGGCILALGAVAIGKGDVGAWIWDPVPSPYPSTSQASLSLANSGDYTLELLGADGVLSSLMVTGNPIRSGISLNRSPDLEGEVLVLHDTLGELPYSPALCPNGGHYAEGCAAEPTPDDGVLDDGVPDCGPDCGPNEMGVDEGPDVEPPQCDPPNPGDLVINEALVDGVEGGGQETDEFVELVNTADRPVDMTGFIVDAIRPEHDPAEYGHFTGGCLAAKGAIAMRRNLEDTVFEPDEAHPGYEPSNKRLANGDQWTFVLRDAGAEFSRLMLTPHPTEGVSENRQPDLTGINPVLHTELSGANSSPARCPNGALYSADCQL